MCSNVNFDINAINLLKRNCGKTAYNRIDIEHLLLNVQNTHVDTDCIASYFVILFENGTDKMRARRKSIAGTLLEL